MMKIEEQEILAKHKTFERKCFVASGHSENRRDDI